MGCKFNSPEELSNLVNNHEALVNIQKNQTQDVTAGFLRTVAAAFTKVDGRYQVEGGARLATTITTQIGEQLSKKSTFVETEKTKKDYKMRGDAGTFVHSLDETIKNKLLAVTSTMSTDEALAYLKTKTWSNTVDSVIDDMLEVQKKFPEIKVVDRNNSNNLESLFEGAKEVLHQIYARQKYINKRTGTKGRVQIFTELILIDAVKDIGGTADLVALYSDNTASVFDYKTKIPKDGKFGTIDAEGNLLSDKYISYYDKEKYKLQLAAIQRILVNRYGVKQVVQSRIVPIQINMAKSAEGTFNGTITKIGYGVKQNPFLAQLSLLPELTGYKDLDEFLTGVEKKTKAYESKVKTDRTNAEYYKNKINELNRAKQSILVKHSLSDLIKYTNDLIDQSNQDKLPNLTLDQLRDIKDELKALTLLAGATYEYREALGGEGSVTEEIKSHFEAQIRDISVRVNDRLYEVEQELYNKRLADTINSLTGYEITDQLGKFISFADEGFFGKYFNQLSQFENPVFKALRAKLSDAQYEIRQSVKEVIADVQKKDDNLRKWMKENGKDDKWLISVLVDTNPDSKNADNLYDKLSPEFRDKIRKIKNDKNIDELIKTFEPSPSYEKWFARESAAKKAYYSRIYEDKKVADRNYEFWAQKNDLSLDAKGKPKYPTAWLGNISSGNLTYRSGVQEQNYSEQYKYVQSIPALADYYGMFETYNKKFRGILGVEFFKLPNNFLPNVRKSNLDRIVDMGVFDGGKSMIDNIMSDLSVREDDQIYGEIDPDTGGLKKTIPRFYLNSFKSKDGKVAIGEKSYDLTKSLILFAKMAYNYQQMNHIEGTVLTMRDFLSEKGTQVIKRGGQPLRDFVSNELASKINGKDIDNIFQSFVDLYLYGVNVNPISENSSGQYEKLILKAKQYFTLKALGLGFIPSIGSFVAAKTQAAIEGYKGQIYTGKQYKEAMQDSYANREKFHALTAFFDPMDVHYDFFSISGNDRTNLGDPRERGFVKKYVNSRMLLRTFSIGDEYIDEVILAAMAKNYYIDSEGDMRRMKNEEDRVKYANQSIWSLFNYNGEDGSFKNLSPEKLKKLKINFKEAAQAAQSKIKGVIPAEDKAYWQTQILGQVVMHFKSWMPGLIRERLGKLKYNDALQVVEMGRFTAFGQELISPDQLALPEFMKSILLPKLGQLVKSVLFFSKFKSTTQQLAFDRWIENNPHYKDKIDFEDFKDAQEKQMKALMLELRIILTFAILMSLMSADFDGDGKKFYQEMWLTRKLVAIMAKTESEISFTYNPKEFANMIKNPIPLAGILTDAVNIIGNTYDEGIDAAFGEKFPFPGHKPQKKDTTGPGYYSLKFVPGVNQMEKFLDIFNQTDPLNR